MEDMHFMARVARSLVASLLALSMALTTALAGVYDLGRSGYWIVVASRDNHAEAAYLAQTIQRDFPETRIFEATNGWYAVTIGAMKAERAKSLHRELVAGNYIPADSFLSRGERFVREVGYQPARPVAPQPPPQQSDSGMSAGQIVFGIIIAAVVLQSLSRSLRNDDSCRPWDGGLSQGPIDARPIC